MGIAQHLAFAGGTGTGVDADQLLKRHRPQGKRIPVAQIGGGGEGQFAQIGQITDIARGEPGFFEFTAIMGGSFVGMANRPAESGQLMGPQLAFARKGWQEIKFVHVRFLQTDISQTGGAETTGRRVFG